MVDLNELYVLLRQWKNKPQTYKHLSETYHKQVGEWVDYHLGWDRPLGDLNKLLEKAGAPALSAVVILQGNEWGGNEPGGGFWGSAPNVPLRPKTEHERLKVWSCILKKVESYDWPPTLRELIGKVV